jgi:hypothetical protein
MLVAQHATMPRTAPIHVLPIWNDCSHCNRFSNCEDPFPPSGDCPHFIDHEIGEKHVARRWPRHWDFYQQWLQIDSELSSIFIRWQLGHSIMEADFLLLRRKVMEAGLNSSSSALLPGPRWFLWELMDDAMAELYHDFVAYYELEIESDHVAWMLQEAFNRAVAASTPEVLEKLVPLGGDWYRYVTDNTRYFLRSLLKLKYLQLDTLSDSEFRQVFETQWQQLLAFRGKYFDFRVIPKLSWNDFVRYQQLPRGDVTIRRTLSSYVTHQALIYPHWIKTEATNFTELAFGRRLRAMYFPLINKTVTIAVRNLEIQSHQQTEREEIRLQVEQAFDGFFQEFDFYWRPEGKESPFGQRGILGVTEDEALREQVDGLFEKEGLRFRTQDMAVYAFAHYIEQRMRRWVKSHYPASEPGIAAKSLDDVCEAQGEPLVDTLSHQGIWPLDAEAYLEEEPDVVSDQGEAYMLIRQAGRRYGLSEHQLRRMDESGSFPALRARDVLGELSRLPAETRLYPRTEAADREAEIAKQRARSRSSHLVGQQLNRKQAAALLGIKEYQLRHLEEAHLVEPQRKGKNVIYHDLAIDQARNVLEQRRQRLQRREILS